MTNAVLSLRLSELDSAAIRARAREVAQIAGLESIQQTRMATAVSEIARNAVDHARQGILEFRLEPSPGGGQCLVAEVRDEGPGIADVSAMLDGPMLPNGRRANGLAGSRRLVDRMKIDSTPQGTRVRLEVDFPTKTAARSADDIAAMAAELVRRRPVSPIVELREQNRELLRVHQELQEKQAALERADERKNQFVKTLVHELRSPLSTIELTLELLRRQPEMGTEQLQKRYATMGRQAAQLTKLVEELMDVARVSQGKLQLDRQVADLNDLIVGAVEMTQGTVRAKAHEVEVRLDAQPVWVEADVPRLTQVACNLIQNSARYTPAGGRIEVQVRREGSEGVFQIADNGIGIAPDLLPHVFELFVQGNNNAAGPEGGLGIGLNLVHHLVSGHGGKVGVTSGGLGQGSTFTVRLPLAEHADP